MCAVESVESVAQAQHSALDQPSCCARPCGFAWPRCVRRSALLFSSRAAGLASTLPMRIRRSAVWHCTAPPPRSIGLWGSARFCFLLPGCDRLCSDATRSGGIRTRTRCGGERHERHERGSTTMHCTTAAAFENRLYKRMRWKGRTELSKATRVFQSILQR